MRCERGVLIVLALGLGAPVHVSGQEGVSVALAEVTSAKLEQTVVLPGELRPFQEVELRARATGFVEAIPVDRGSRVRKGELIASLRAPELEAMRAEAAARMAAAEAGLAEAEARLAGSASTAERLARAAETPGVVAGNDLLLAQKTADADRDRVVAAEKSVEAAQAALDSMAQMIGYLRVTAPFAGVVTERHVHVGSLVGPDVGSNPLVKLEQIRRLRLVTSVPESQAGGIVEGAQVRFTVSTYPGASFDAVVARAARSVSPRTRTMPVEADVDNSDERLAPGMYAEVSWPVRRGGESLFVPTGAVAETTERIFVIRVKGGRAEWVDVRRGSVDGDRVEVLGPLQAGDRVVARATDEIRPGTPVSEP